MLLLIFYVSIVFAQDLPANTEIWMGLKAGLQKNGVPGACLQSYPQAVEAYTAFQSTLELTSFSPKLHSFQLFFAEFSKLVTTCKVESLFESVFGIYKWDVLKPILYNLAGNLTYFLLLVNYFNLAVVNGFEYDIGFYLGQIIQNRPEMGNGLTSVAALRLNKDLEELAIKRFSTDYTQFSVSMPYLEDIYICLPVLFKVKSEAGSLYSNAVFDAVIKITPAYPFKPPIMLVRNQVYHPNIDIDTGLVYLSVLQHNDWKPVFTINTIIFAFELVLHSPDFECMPENFVNTDMKLVFFNNSQTFTDRVKFTMQGGWVLEKYYFEHNYGAMPESKRKQKHSLENTKKFKFTQDCSEMSVEICLRNN